MLLEELLVHAILIHVADVIRVVQFVLDRSSLAHKVHSDFNSIQADCVMFCTLF